MVLVVLVGLSVGGWMLFRNREKSIGRVDRQAQLMSKRSEIYKLTREGAQEKANQLGAGHAGPGILIGRTVANTAGEQPLRGGVRQLGRHARRHLGSPYR